MTGGGGVSRPPTHPHGDDGDDVRIRREPPDKVETIGRRCQWGREVGGGQGMGVGEGVNGEHRRSAAGQDASGGETSFNQPQGLGTE